MAFQDYVSSPGFINVYRAPKKGQWNIGNFNVPDLGYTEDRGINDNYSSAPAYSFGGGQVQGTTDTRTDNQPQQTPAPNQTPAGGGNYTPIPTSTQQSSGDSDGKKEAEEGYNEQQSLIDNQYKDNESFLNRLQSTTMQGEQDFYNTYTAPYASQVPMIQQSLDQGLQSIENQKGVTGQQEQSALAAARQLFNELTQRNQQAFGGGLLSSVGQAAGEILGRGAQQAFGNIRQGAQNTIQGLMTEARNVQAQADAQLQQLEMQKQAALSEARLAFRDKLAEIDRMKTELKSKRTDWKLAALQEFRSNIQNIANQATAFQQSLQAMKYQADLNLRNAQSSVASAVNNGVESGQSMLGQQGAGNDISYNQFGAGNQISAQESPMAFGGLPIPGASVGKRRDEQSAYDILSNQA